MLGLNLLLLMLTSVLAFDYKCVENYIRNETLIQLKNDPALFNNFLVGVVAAKCETRQLRILLKMNGVDPRASNNFALVWAAREGQGSNVRALLKWKNGAVDRTANNFEALRSACEMGHDRVVRSLLVKGQFQSKMPDLLPFYKIAKGVETLKTLMRLDPRIKNLETYIKREDLYNTTEKLSSFIRFAYKMSKKETYNDYLSLSRNRDKVKLILNKAYIENDDDMIQYISRYILLG